MTTPMPAAFAGSLRPYSALPRAGRLPLVGSIPQLLHEGFDYLQRTREELGDIFVLDLGVREFVLVADPLAAEHVLVKASKNFDKGGDFWDLSRESLGNGLAFSEGELWRRQRRLMNPAFRRQRLTGLQATIEATVDEELDSFAELSAGGEDLEVSAWTRGLLSTLTVRLLMGTSLAPSEFTKIRNAMQIIIQSVLPGMVTRWLPRWLPAPGRARLEQARRDVSEVVTRIISQRRGSDDEGNDLLGMLLATTDEQGAMSDEQLRDEMMVTYVAGYETTAWALAWSLLLLARHPEHLSKLQAAIDEGADPLALPLLDGILREALRIYPPAPFLPRRAVVDEELLGYSVPAGVTVLVMPLLIHHNSAHWPDPTRFDPTRHLESVERPRLAWMPFGAGQRTCIGQGLAMMEIKITLAKLLRRFTLAPCQGPHRCERSLSPTLSASDGIWIRADRR